MNRAGAMQHRQRRGAAISLLAAMSVFACAETAPVTSRLDSSGLTLVTLGEAIVLARAVPRLSLAARDYIYLGPIEINRMGKRDHYMWVGLASTVDRAFVDLEPPAATSLALLVDGQPMSLPLAEWNREFDQPPYATAAPLYATYSARASLDQIHRVAGATEVSVHIISASGGAVQYRMWQGDWSSFSLLVRAD